MKVDGKLQYGQKNAQGELQFVVYHDKECKPYQVRQHSFKTVLVSDIGFQHHFIETAVGSATAGKAQEMAKAFGFGAAGDQFMGHLRCIVGDYLYTF